MINVTCFLLLFYVVTRKFKDLHVVCIFFLLGSADREMCASFRYFTSHLICTALLITPPF